METLYTDCVSSFNLHNNMIRIVLGTMAESENSIEPIKNHTVVIMPIQGFLKAAISANQLLEKMEEAGVIKKKEEQENKE